MNASLLTAIRQAADEAMQSFQIPGLAIAVVQGTGAVQHLMLGEDAAGQPLALDRLFLVASVTKLGTALAVLRLVDSSDLSLDDPLVKHLPEAAAAQPGVTLRRLLSHSSGLPLDLPDGAAPYRPGLDWPALKRACLEVPLERAPNTYVQYSNVGYGLLALLVERQTGQPFPSALQTLVLEPLGIEGYLGVEPPRPPAVIADVRSEHSGTSLEPFNSAFWRSLGLPWGGLVTSLDGALALVRAFKRIPQDFLGAEIAAETTHNQTNDLKGGFVPPLEWPRCPWGLGPEIRDEKHPHWAPAEASRDSFGHSGASGAVAWADPATDVAWAILGTRTADNGWLVRRGPAIGQTILRAAGT